MRRRLQVAAWHADGHELPIELSRTATISPDGPVFHAFCSTSLTWNRRIHASGPRLRPTPRGLRPIIEQVVEDLRKPVGDNRGPGTAFTIVSPAGTQQR